LEKLTLHAQQMKKSHMNDFFNEDKQRFNKFSLLLPSMLLDYSKNLITEETRSLLISLAKACDVETWRDKMFKGERINGTEDRAVLHTALRDEQKTPIFLDGENINECVAKLLDKM
jgi:glucose-6-phosphate isomerase